MNRRKKTALLTLLGFKPKRKRVKRRRPASRPRGWSAVEAWVAGGGKGRPRKRATRRRAPTGPRGWTVAYDQINGKKAPVKKPAQQPHRTLAESKATCSWCGARPGQKCITPSGRNTDAHADRLRVAYGKGVR